MGKFLEANTEVCPSHSHLGLQSSPCLLLTWDLTGAASPKVTAIQPCVTPYPLLGPRSLLLVTSRIQGLLGSVQRCLGGV